MTSITQNDRHISVTQSFATSPARFFNTITVCVVIGGAALGALPASAASSPGPVCAYNDTSYFNGIVGTTPSVSVQFIADQPDSRGGWANYDGSAWYVASSVPATTTVSVAVPLFPAISGTSLGAAAAGTYNTHYVNAARQLLAYGHGDAFIRPGWEFQGNWYAWGYNYPGQNKTSYCSSYTVAFQQVVKSFRSVSSSFRFIWNPDLSDSSVMPNIGSCYPGDSWVDSIGLDVYDFNYFNISDPVQRFQHDVLQREFGLQWQLGVAQRHNKTLSYPEWGVGAVGDNPYMVQQMAGWFTANNTQLQCYWNGSAASGYDGNLQDYPQEAAMYQSVLRAP
jgi:hypothetical protein